MVSTLTNHTDKQIAYNKKTNITRHNHNIQILIYNNSLLNPVATHFALFHGPGPIEHKMSNNSTQS